MKHTRLSMALAFAGAATAASAQDAAGLAKEPVAARAATRASFGVAADGDGFAAGGPDYKARFDANGWSFTPALGRSVPEDLPITFALESIRRGDGASVIDVAAAAPTSEGSVVRYARGGGVDESYVVRADGIEQRFHFAAPLEGHGDLVVRGRVTTELAGAIDGDGLRFAHAAGGVRFGAITGFDARGAHVAGSFALDGERVEMRLPGAWLEHAQFPVVMDPLVGSFFNVSGSDTLDDSEPDAAYDATNALYLVVWSRAFSGGDADIRGQRVGANGQLVGGLIGIESANNTISVHPSVGDVNVTDRFFVAWQQTISPNWPDVMGRSVSAATGAASAGILSIATTSAIETSPDVAGKRRSSTIARSWCGRTTTP